MKSAIDSGSLNRISMLLKVFKKSSKPSLLPIIDQEIININNIKLNALAYSLFLGKLQIFRYFYEKGASLKAMDELLSQSNLRAVNIICYKGHKDLLEFYLPLYLKDYSSLPISHKSFTIDFKDSLLVRPEFDLAIHSACRAGMIHIVLYLHKYFEKKEYCPSEFDINAKDEYFAEDAGLIACRIGNFALIKMLYEVCGVNFQQVNANQENAIMICLSGFKNNPNYSYFECVSYLLEVVGLDITYHYEETLDLAEGKELVSYIEERLEKAHIYAKKKDIEVTAPVFRPRREVVADNSRETLFSEEARRYINSDMSIVSSISEIESRFDPTHSCLLNDNDLDS